jgi:hypothetical protein
MKNDGDRTIKKRLLNFVPDLFKPDKNVNEIDFK